MQTFYNILKTLENNYTNKLGGAKHRRLVEITKLDTEIEILDECLTKIRHLLETYESTYNE